MNEQRKIDFIAKLMELYTKCTPNVDRITDMRYQTEDNREYIIVTAMDDIQYRIDITFDNERAILIDFVTFLDNMQEYIVMPGAQAQEPEETWEEIRGCFMREYEATKDGQRLTKKFANMETEWEKYGKHSDISASDYVYLNEKYYGSFYNGGHDMYKLGFVAGRRKHIAEMKKNAKQK